MAFMLHGSELREFANTWQKVCMKNKLSLGLDQSAKLNRLSEQAHGTRDMVCVAVQSLV